MPKVKPGWTATVAVQGIPEALALMRSELATNLRAKAARQENDVVGWAVAKALRDVADAFEVGLKDVDG